MIRLIALGGVLLASLILLLILREERLTVQGKVPMGRLRRLWWRAERRRAPRYRVDWSVRYLRMNSNPAVRPPPAETPGQIRDISRLGVGFVVQERLPVGTHLQMAFSISSQDEPLAITGEVVWTKEVPALQSSDNTSRSFLVGVRFRDLTSQEVEALAFTLVGKSPEKETSLDSARQAAAYARIRRKLWLLDLGISIGLFAFLLFSGLAQQLAQWVSSGIRPWPLQVALTIGLLALAAAAVTFPLDWLRGFRLEHRFGLSTQSFTEWLKDYGKGLAVAAILGLIVLESFSLLLRMSPQGWWAWAAVLWMLWSVGLTRVAPQWLIPIFYRQRPLEELGLRQRLEKLLEKCRTPVRGIFEINLSRTTRKANACLCGLGSSRRVLLSDTLLSGYPTDEVEVVLAHEVGHHRLRHIGILIVGNALAVGLSCFLVEWVVRRSMAPLGLRGLEDPATLLLIGWGLTVAQLGLLPVTNGLSRLLEAQADRFALQATRNPRAFAAAMRRLAEQNLAEISPPRWVEWLLYDHPAIARRIAMAKAYRPE